jgi:protein-arginine kinase activator protein McsA
LYESIDALAEKMDAEKAAILAELKPVEDAISEACRVKDFERAALGFEQIAEALRLRHFTGDAECYRQRARDIRDAARRAKRAKKHGGHK